MMDSKLSPMVVVVTSNKLLRNMVASTIERYPFRVIRSDTQYAIRDIGLDNPNIVIIGYVEPESNTRELALSVLKKQPKMPIIIVVGPEDVELESDEEFNRQGMFSFLRMPLNTIELMTEIKDILKATKQVAQNKVLEFRNMKLDMASYRVFKSDVKINIGPTEFKILRLMMQNPHHIFSREEIIERIWGEGHVIDARTIDVHINRLRSLIKMSKDEPQFIKTIRSKGYSLMSYS